MKQYAAVTNLSLSALVCNSMISIEDEPDAVCSSLSTLSTLSKLSITNSEPVHSCCSGLLMLTFIIILVILGGTSSGGTQDPPTLPCTLQHYMANVYEVRKAEAAQMKRTLSEI